MDHVFENRTDVFFERRESGNVGIGRIGQEQVDALLAQTREGPQVGESPVQRQLVHLEVTGVQHRAGRRADGHGERVRDGVVDRDELEIERAELFARAFAHRQGVGRNAVFLELRLNEGEREW
ncbi:unannotated protein [freshwater metagenome]|uniref:Unannotated protein n=1 Tax=freshwater metagenome TaxID=449393 RepID=A0A6J7FZV9_9ZZZZ